MDMRVSVVVYSGESMFQCCTLIDVDAIEVDESVDDLEYMFNFEVADIHTVIDEIIENGEFDGEFDEEAMSKMRDELYDAIESDIEVNYNFGYEFYLSADIDLGE